MLYNHWHLREVDCSLARPLLTVVVMSPVAAATMKHFFGTICWHNILAECIDLPPHLVPARQLWPLSSLFLWDVYVYTCEDLLTNFIIIFAPVRLLCSVTRLGDFFTLGNYLKPVCIILDEIVWQFCKGVKILSCKTASEIFRQLLIDIGRLFNQTIWSPRHHYANCQPQPLSRECFHP